MGTYLIQSCPTCGALLHAKDVELHTDWHRKMQRVAPAEFLGENERGSMVIRLAGTPSPD